MGHNWEQGYEQESYGGNGLPHNSRVSDQAQRQPWRLASLSNQRTFKSPQVISVLPSWPCHARNPQDYNSFSNLRHSSEWENRQSYVFWASSLPCPLSHSTTQTSDLHSCLPTEALPQQIFLSKDPPCCPHEPWHEPQSTIQAEVSWTAGLCYQGRPCIPYKNKRQYSYPTVAKSVQQCVPCTTTTGHNIKNPGDSLPDPPSYRLENQKGVQIKDATGPELWPLWKPETMEHLLWECENYSEPLWGKFADALTQLLSDISQDEVPRIVLGQTNIIFNIPHPSLLLHIRDKESRNALLLLVQEIKRDIIYRRLNLPPSAQQLIHPRRLTAHLGSPQPQKPYNAYKNSLLPKNSPRITMLISRFPWLTLPIPCQH